MTAPTAYDRHRFVALGATLGALGVWFWLRPGQSGQLVLLGTLVAVLGIPHGAVDDLLAYPLLPGRARLTTFVTLYLGVAGVVLLGWLAAPVPSLLAFLALSVVHFGLGDTPADRRGVPRAISVVARGGIPVILPVVAHPDIVTGLFATLTLQPLAVATIRAIGAVAAVPFAVAWALELGRTLARSAPSAARRVSEASELLLLAALFIAAAPLWAFAIYFGLWHSGRHILALAGRFEAPTVAGGIGQFARQALPYTAATLLLAGAGYLGLRSTAVEVSAAVVSVTFVGLSILTVPHMIVTALNARGRLSPR